MVRRAYLAAVVGAILMGCALLVVIGCAGVRSEAPKEEQQERTNATRAKGRSPEATASEEVARCEGTRTFQAQGGPFTTNDLPGCPKGGPLAGTDKADKLDGKDGDDEIRGLGTVDVIFGGLGNDVIYGGPGDDDPLMGEEGDDVVYGGGGDDGLEDSSGADVFYGGDGDDDITTWADGQRDEIYCGKGKDSYVADRHDHVSSDCEEKQEVTRMF